MSINGKVAVITGGAGGIGRAAAHRFAKAGARVVIADSDEEAGQKVLSELTNGGFQAEYIQCNVAEGLDVHNLIAVTLEAFGQVDILLNASSIRDNKPFMKLSEQEFSSILDVNLKGAFLLGKSVARQMIKQVEKGSEPGAIIFISSTNAVLADPSAVAYCVANGGLGQLTKAMAQALAPHGIRVNAIGPSNLRRDSDGKVISTGDDNENSQTPMGRYCEPDEIAAIATFLAGKDASYITGQTIYADGGAMSMRRAIKQPDS
ncbi:MAG: dehydrogenase [Rhodomicrobium sp.]|nr:MAG: dehydrogenase [Rhodomicrobium sp.]